jgi:type IVB pilus formation R64 PilN family outer membrane protein
MLNLRHLGISILGFSLLGCSGHRLHDELQVVSEQVQEEVTQQRNQTDMPVVIFVDTPIGSMTSVPIINTPDWYARPHAVTSQGLPFYLLVDDLARNNDVVVQYGADVDLQLPVHLVYLKGSAKGALDAMAASSGYTYSATDKQITWQKYQTQRFDLSYVGGNYNYLIGNEAGTAADANSVLGSNASQFQNIKSTGSNVFEEVAATLDLLLDGVGQVVLSEASSSVVVRTTPERMVSVSSYLEGLNNALSTQVLLDVKVLKFRHKSSAASGIDWSLVRQNASSTLSFAGAVATGRPLSGAPTTLEAIATTGDLSNSKILISVLEEQGSVSVVTEPRILTQVNRVAELKMAEARGYIEKTTINRDGEGNISTSVEPGTVTDGYNIYVLSNVDAHDRIYLHISSMLSDILNIEKKIVGDAQIEAPNVNENQFSQTIVMRPGQTVLANSLKQVVSSNNASSPLDATSQATFKSGQQVVEETLVLITPTILRLGPAL